MTWYYTRNGQQFGPHSEEELRRFIAEGRISSSELIWKAGMPGWVPAHDVFPPAVPAGGPPPPPPPPGWGPPQQGHPGALAYPGPPQPGYGPGPGHGQVQPAYVPPQGAYGPASDRRQRIAYILLGVFVGTLGIHNFYAGYVGRGVAQLLITIFIGWLLLPLLAVWIWNLVEIVVVTQDSKGVPFT
jgi:TM2 domain-containing membrane protein YozV